MSEQKTVEELTRELNKIDGECTYYKNLSGRYRQENHKNYGKMKLYRMLFYIALGFFVLSVIAVICIGVQL